MKIKTVFISLMLLASALSFSQTEKGKWTLSGSSTFQATKSSMDVEGGTISNTTIMFNPSVGYFVVKDLSVGLGLGFLSQDNQSTFSIMPTASYFIPTKSIIRPFAQVGIGYSALKEYGYTSDGLAMGFGAGVAIFANKNFSVDMGLQALLNKYDPYTMFTYGGMIGLSVFF